MLALLVFIVILIIIKTKENLLLLMCCYYYYYTFLTFMQCIYNYIPETNHVSRVYSVAAVLYLQFVLYILLFFPWNTFCTFTLVLSVVRVQCPIWLFFVFTEIHTFLVCCSVIIIIIIARTINKNVCIYM
jgi:hypothetical protein